MECVIDKFMTCLLVIPYIKEGIFLNKKISFQYFYYNHRT